MWFLFKRLRYIFIYYTCAFSCHRECAEVRGHLVEVDSPAIWGLGCQDGLYPLALGVRFLPLSSHHLGTQLPSQQVCMWG